MTRPMLREPNFIRRAYRNEAVQEAALGLSFIAVCAWLMWLYWLKTKGMV